MEEIADSKKAVSATFLFLPHARSPLFPKMILINPTWDLNALAIFKTFTMCSNEVGYV
jgi:hypothetical protein